MCNRSQKENLYKSRILWYKVANSQSIFLFLSKISVLLNLMGKIERQWFITYFFVFFLSPVNTNNIPDWFWFGEIFYFLIIKYVKDPNFRMNNELFLLRVQIIKTNQFNETWWENVHNNTMIYHHSKFCFLIVSFCLDELKFDSSKRLNALSWLPGIAYCHRNF